MVIDSTADFSAATEALKKRSGRDADAHPFSQMPSATWLQRVLTTFSFSCRDGLEETTWIR